MRPLHAHTAKNARLAQRGMTLLEIMIVIAILGLLATLVATKMSGSLTNAKIKTTQIKIQSTSTMVTNYYMTVDEYPNSLKDLLNPPNGFKALVDKMPQDAWNNDLILKRVSGAVPFVVYSAGIDGQKGTADDIYAKGEKK